MRFLRKLTEPRILKRIFYERLAEPLHLNLFSIPVALFGSYRMKIEFDLIMRQHHAFAILRAADQAAALGLRSLRIVEFGVAAGGGLMNMSFIAERVTALTGVEIEVVGFDTGHGMPIASDYRDHPDLYWQGDFPMQVDVLRSKLPPNAQLVIGDLAETARRFREEQLRPESPVGYIAVDVDYYTSTISALKLLEGAADYYLPLTFVYLDDVALDAHNVFAGEMLAVSEFNARNELRKILRHDFLEDRRLFRRAEWIKHMYYFHVMDHPSRSQVAAKPVRVIQNPYLA